MADTLLTTDEWRTSVLRWCAYTAPAGAEGKLVEDLLHDIQPLADQVWVDPLGNGIAHHTGRGPRVLICAPVDEPGLMVMDVDNSGLLRVAALGAAEPQRWVGRLVRFVNGVTGVIGAETSAKRDALDVSHLYVDIGVSSRAEALERVHVGLSGVIGDEAVPITPTCVAGRAVANRVGAAAAMAAYRRTTEADLDVSVAFTTQRATGHRGVRTAVRAVDADLILVIESVPVPEATATRDGGMRLGAGPALRLRDPNLVLPVSVQRSVERVATTAGISLQPAVLTDDGSDAGVALQMSNVPVVSLGVPVRRTSADTAMVHLRDVEATASLALALVRHADTLVADENML